jgi:phage FluMu protein gp41
MPDLFDTVAELPASPKADVFDHLAPDKPAGDLFDQVAAAPSPNALRLQAVAIGAEPPRNALEQDIQNLHGRSRGSGMGFREAPGTSKTRSLYDLATAPLATLANGVTAQMVNDARDVLMANSEVNQLAAVAKAQGFPLSTAQVQQLYEARIARPQQKPEKIDQAVAGVQNVAANAVNSLTSPVGIATLGQGALPSVLGKAVTGAFVADMARHTPEAARAAGEASVNGDLQQKIEAYGNLGVTAAFAAGMGQHLGKGVSLPNRGAARTIEDLPASPENTISSPEPARINEFTPEPEPTVAENARVDAQPRETGPVVSQEPPVIESQTPSSLDQSPTVKESLQVDAQPRETSPVVSQEPDLVRDKPAQTSSPAPVAGENGWHEVFRVDRSDVPSGDEFRKGAHWGTLEQANAILRREQEAGRKPGLFRRALIKSSNPLQTFDGGFWEKVVKEADQAGNDAIVYPNEGEGVGGVSYIPLQKESLHPTSTDGFELVNGQYMRVAGDMPDAIKSLTIPESVELNELRITKENRGYAPDKVETFLDGLKVDTNGKVFDAVQGLPIAAWNGLVDITKAAYVGGKKLAEAIQEGIDWLRENHPGVTFNERELRQELGRAAEPDLRQHGQRLLGGPLSEETLGNISAFDYARRTNESDRETAQRILDNHPLDDVVQLLTSEGRRGIDGPVQTVLYDLALERLAKEEQLAALMGQHEQSSRLSRQQGDISDMELSRRTDLAQSLQAANRFGLMSVGGILHTARRQFEKATGKAGEIADKAAESIRRAFADGFARGRENAMQDKTLNTELGRAVDAGIATHPQILLEAGKQVKTLEERQALIQQRLQAIRNNRLARVKETIGSGVPPEEVPGNPLDELLRTELRRVQGKLRDVMMQNDAVVDTTGKTLGDLLAAASSVPGGGAKRLGRVLQERFKQLVTDARRKELDRLSKDTPSLPRKVKHEFERLLELSNLGLFNDRQLYEKVREKYGLPSWTAEIQSEVNRRAEAIQKMPRDSLQRQRATGDLLTYLKRQTRTAARELPMAFWYAHVLSEPFTHLKNVIGNLYNGAAYTGLAALKSPRDIPGMIVELGRGLAAGTLDAADVIKTGQQTGIRFGAKLDAAPVIERLPKIFLPWKLVWRTLAAEDMLFFRAQEEMRSHVEAARMARAEGKEGKALKQRIADIMGRTEEKVTAAQLQAHQEGLTGLDLRRRTDQILHQQRPEALRETARDHALRSTFNQRPEGVLGSLANSYNAQAAKFSASPDLAPRMVGSVMRLAVPFTGVVTNVVNEGLMYVPPVGYSRAIWGHLRGRMMGREVKQGEVIDTAVKATVGLLMIAGLGSLAAKNLEDDDPQFMIYGRGPSDRKQRQALEALGWRPYTVKMGSQYINYSQSPTALALSWVGNYLDARKWKSMDKTDALNRVALASLYLGNVVTDSSWLDGMAGLITVLDKEPNAKAGEKALQQAARTAAGFVIPNAVMQVDQLFDANAYEANSVETSVILATPFARRTLKPAVNALGEPITKERIRQFVSERKADPLWELLNAKGAWPSVVDQTVYVGVKGSDRYRALTPDERYDFTVASGQRLKTLLTKILPALQRADSETAQRLVRAATDNARAIERAKLSGYNTGHIATH